MHDLFMTKFFPPAKTTELRARITSYKQLPGETFVDTWERFKDLCAKCPTHGQPPYVLQQNFFMGVDAPTRARINLHTSCSFLDMDPKEAWALIDKLTNYDAMYEIPFNASVSGRGLYEVSPDVDLEVRAQARADETNRLRRQLDSLKANEDSLKACQICHSKAHTASSCTNREQFNAAESYMTEEARYVQRPYPPRNGPYMNQDAFPPGPRVPPPAQEQRPPPYKAPVPYLHPGTYQEPSQHQRPANDPVFDMFRRLEQKLDSNRKAQDEDLQGVRAQLKGVNAHLKDMDSHLGDIDVWRRNVDTQLGDLAQRIPRPKDNFRLIPMKTQEDI